MKHNRIGPHGKAFLGFGLLLVILLAISFSSAGELKSFKGCELVAMKGSDGDSFRVKLPNGSHQIVRLYGVDCIEATIWDEADSRRLIEQRSYFGIRNYGNSNIKSIELAKSLGTRATDEVNQILSKPFQIYTSFADGRGSGYHKRVYAFVTTADGVDLGEHLVKNGLARAHGVNRRNPQGFDQNEMEERLLDLEFQAAQRKLGVWTYTDWSTFSDQRAKRRAEQAEILSAIDRLKHTSVVDPNTAPRDQLMTLNGIGEKLALRIIEGRPYQGSVDLLKVKGLGQTTLRNLSPRLPKAFHLPLSKSET